jgi:hypothetical protein
VAQRIAVRALQTKFELSERRACALVGLGRSMSLSRARETIEMWRLDYNAVRPHSALGDVPPQEFEQLTTAESRLRIRRSRHRFQRESLRPAMKGRAAPVGSVKFTEFPPTYRYKLTSAASNPSGSRCVNRPMTES